jgi:Protein of unknown function (DUF1579)
MIGDPQRAGLERLNPLIGTWRVTASFANAGGSEEGAAHCEFEWVLGGAFMLVRSTGPDPAPDSLEIIGFDPASESYSQHYFDSRGVARMYAMTLENGVCTLLRDSPDFSPLEFSQRFTGVFGDEGNSIAGQWETPGDGSNWEHDFDLTFSRVR